MSDVTGTTFGHSGIPIENHGLRSGSFGAFLGETINYLIIAFVMFLVIKAYNHFNELIDDDDEEATASESKEVVLLKEIRDGINNLTKS